MRLKILYERLDMFRIDGSLSQWIGLAELTLDSKLSAVEALKQLDTKWKNQLTVRVLRDGETAEAVLSQLVSTAVEAATDGPSHYITTLANSDSAAAAAVSLVDSDRGVCIFSGISDDENGELLTYETVDDAAMLTAEEKPHIIVHCDKSVRPTLIDGDMPHGSENRLFSTSSAVDVMDLQEQHKCFNCEKSFKHPSVLRRHIKIHAKEASRAATTAAVGGTVGAVVKDIIREGGRKASSELFPCSTCSRKFTIRCRLVAHMRIHTGEQPYTCDICQHSFSANKYLKEHRRKHTDEKPHVCEICGNRFIHKSSLQNHHRRHVGEKPFICTRCGKAFVLKSDLTQHTQTHTGEKRHKCAKCGKRFSSRRVLTFHMFTHTGEKPFACHVCHRGFRHPRRCHEHLENVHKITRREGKTVTGPSTSANDDNMMDKTHDGNSEFSQQNSMPTSVKKNTCTLCQKSFQWPGQLVKHIRMHTGDKPFTCEHCDKRFTQQSNLVAHRRIHRNDRPYVCQHCTATFVNASHFKGHLRIHAGDRRYECKFCEITFASSSSRRRHHSRLHTTGDKPYKCKDCGKDFYFSADYRKHATSHKKSA